MMPPPPTSQDNGNTYTVQPGDTWQSIAAQLGVSAQDLQAANPDIDNPQPGDTLTVPGAGGAGAGAPAPAMPTFGAGGAAPTFSGASKKARPGGLAALG